MITNQSLNTSINDGEKMAEFSPCERIQSSKKRRSTKPKKSDSELVQAFWYAPIEAFFRQETVAAVTSESVKTLECNRWRGIGIPFRKIGGRVLYRKEDIVTYLEGHKLVNSTSQYNHKGVSHGV